MPYPVEQYLELETCGFVIVCMRAGIPRVVEGCAWKAAEEVFAAAGVGYWKVFAGQILECWTKS